MIYSSPYNSIWFKSLGGTYQNTDNTLHNNMKIGGIKTICYYQKINNDHVSYLQFYSESNSNITVTVKAEGVFTNITSVATISNYGGSIYFFNYNFTASSIYQDKYVEITIVQDGNTITSESILVEDLTEDLANGRIMYAKYTNYEKQDNNIMNSMIDWSVIDNTGHYMDFFIEAHTNELNALDEVENLKTAINNVIIGGSLFSGSILRSGEIPEYMVKKLAVCSALDVFEVNNLRYIKQTGIKNTMLGTSNLSQIELSLLQKNALGVNVDTLGVTATEENPLGMVKEFENKTSSFNLEIPDGYMVHTVLASHAALSSMEKATIIGGYSFGSEALIDSFGGTLKGSVIPKSFPLHARESFDSAAQLYIGVSGSGVILRFRIDFILNETS